MEKPRDESAKVPPPPDLDGQVVLRGAGWPGDKEFVGSSWRRNYDSAEHTRCPGGIAEYIATQSMVIEQCLRNSEVVLASPWDRPEQILGWICGREGPVIHYVYVKPYYRASGIAMRLIKTMIGEARTVYITHSTKRPGANAIAALLGKARSTGIYVVYNPALIFGGKK